MYLRLKQLSILVFFIALTINAQASVLNSFKIFPQYFLLSVLSLSSVLCEHPKNISIIELKNKNITQIDLQTQNITSVDFQEQNISKVSLENKIITLQKQIATLNDQRPHTRIQEKQFAALQNYINFLQKDLNDNSLDVSMLHTSFTFVSITFGIIISILCYDACSRGSRIKKLENRLFLLDRQRSV